MWIFPQQKQFSTILDTNCCPITQDTSDTQYPLLTHRPHMGQGCFSQDCTPLQTSFTSLDPSTSDPPALSRGFQNPFQQLNGFQEKTMELKRTNNFLFVVYDQEVVLKGRLGGVLGMGAYVLVGLGTCSTGMRRCVPVWKCRVFHGRLSIQACLAMMIKSIPSPSLSRTHSGQMVGRVSASDTYCSGQCLPL